MTCTFLVKCIPVLKIIFRIILIVTFSPCLVLNGYCHCRKKKMSSCLFLLAFFIRVSWVFFFTVHTVISSVGEMCVYLLYQDLHLILHFPVFILLSKYSLIMIMMSPCYHKSSGKRVTKGSHQT